MATPKRYLHDIDLAKNKLINARIQPVTTAERISLSYTASEKGIQVYDTDLDKQFNWNGSAWIELSTITSIGLTMPTAFSVVGSPLTTSGAISVSGAGFISQYVRGDGTLADFPGGGGGSSVSYYLNGSINQGTINSDVYYEMNKTPVIGAGTTFSIASNGYIAQFVTDVGDPNLLNIPAGSWNIQFYVNANSAGGSPNFYVELYKYDGTTLTLLASSSSSPEFITGGTNIDLYYTSLSVPATTLLLTDRLAIRVYVNNSGKTITLHTEGTTLAEIITTFSTGLTALNGLTNQVQFLTIGTSGTDFNISSATSTHTFNIPNASGTNRGLLTSADWTIFNNKQSAITLTTTGSNGSATFVGNTLNIPTYTLAGLGGISLTSLSAVSPLIYDNATGQFDINDATSVQNGYLTSTDWTTFNSKQSAITLTTTGSSGAATFISNTLNIPTYTLSGLGGVSGSGTTNYLPKWTGSTALGNSLIQDDGTNVAIGITPATYKFRVSGNAFSSSYFVGTTSNTSDQFKAGGLISLASSGTSSYTQIGYNSTLNCGWITALTEGVSYRGIIIANNNQNVGIGSLNAPSSGLEIEKSNFPAISLKKTGTAVWTIGNRTESTGTNFNISYGTTDILNVTAAGRVLIGTTTESTYELDVVGDIRSTLDANINGLTVGKGGGSVATNTAIGFEAINASATGAGNVAIGYRAGRAITSGVYNVLTGFNAGVSLTTGSYNYAYGMYAARLLTTGAQNVLIGYNAGATLTTQNNNVFIGHSSGNDAISSNNVGVGYWALRTLTTATLNTSIGYQSGIALTTGDANIMIGANNALGLTTGSENVLIGNNIMAATSTASQNTIVGSFAGNALSANANTYFGWYAGSSASSSVYNVGIGWGALQNITTGASNTAIGARAGRFFGSGTSSNTTGTQGIFVGYQTRASADGNTNETVIGYDVVGNGSNSVTLGNSSIAKTVLQGNVLIGTTTDAGYKLDVNGTFRSSGNGRFDGSDSRDLTIAGTTYQKATIIRPGTILLSDGSVFSTYVNLESLGNTGRMNFAQTFDFRSGSTYSYNQLMILDASGTFTFNNGQADINYFFKTDNSSNTLYIDGGLDNIGMGTNSPNASALLDVTSTTKGFLPPRLTTTQKNAITTPAAGLVVYDTTLGKLCVYTTAWETITSA